MFLAFRGQAIEVLKGTDGLWRSHDGTVWAFEEAASKNDPVDRCGVDPWALPVDNPLTSSCKPHDFAYSSPAYQAFHTRAEADAYLESLIAHNPTWWRFMARPFWAISRLFGSRYWENPKTND